MEEVEEVEEVSRKQATAAGYVRVAQPVAAKYNTPLTLRLALELISYFFHFLHFFHFSTSSTCARERAYSLGVALGVYGTLSTGSA